MKIRTVLVNLAIGYVACICVSSCSVHRETKSAQSFCADTPCLQEKIMDLSLPDAQRYLFIRRAVERGFRVEDTSNHFQQVYATLASFVGDYENARKYYPLKDPAENPALRGFLTASPAIPILRALARSKQAVFVNEAHATAETRAAIYTFLRPLREEGYTYLAIEGLTSMPPLDGATCSDAILFDAELPVRGYPTAKSGFYIREPIFAEIIREALRLGFKLVAYETTDTADDSVEGREERQARNIACVFKGDPKAKLVAIAGFSHVNKSVNSELPGGWMASRFRSMTRPGTRASPMGLTTPAA